MARGRGGRSHGHGHGHHFGSHGFGHHHHHHYGGGRGSAGPSFETIIDSMALATIGPMALNGTYTYSAN